LPQLVEGVRVETTLLITYQSRHSLLLQISYFLLYHDIPTDSHVVGIMIDQLQSPKVCCSGSPDSRGRHRNMLLLERSRQRLWLHRKDLIDKKSLLSSNSFLEVRECRHMPPRRSCQPMPMDLTSGQLLFPPNIRNGQHLLSFAINV